MCWQMMYSDTNCSQQVKSDAMSQQQDHKTCSSHAQQQKIACGLIEATNYFWGDCTTHLSVQRPLSLDWTSGLPFQYRACFWTCLYLVATLSYQIIHLETSAKHNINIYEGVPITSKLVLNTCMQDYIDVNASSTLSQSLNINLNNKNI